MNIEQIIRKVLPNLSYKEGGGEIKFLCPFHQEKHASCFLNLNTGTFHCFGCHKGGSIEHFLTLLQLPEHEVKSIVAGVELEYKPRIEIPKFATRTVKEEQILDEKILLHFLYKPASLIDLGYPEDLLWAYKIGFHIDRSRIIYPLRNEHGNLVGVSGGSTIGMMPKYKVYRGCYEANGYSAPSDYGAWFDELYPSYGILDKSKLIWNFDTILKRAQYEALDEVFIVEGFKAALFLMKNGYKNVVALLGSWITETQALLLSKIKTKYCLMLDNDLAGQSGTEEVIYKLYKVCSLFKIEYPSKQPDDLNKETLQNTIANKKIISLRTFKEIANKKEKEKHVQSKKYPSTNQYHKWNHTTKQQNF